MLGWRKALMILGAVAIVALAFATTTFVLNRLPYVLDDQSTGAITVAQDRRGENLLWPSVDLNSPNWKRYETPRVQPTSDKSPNGGAAAFRLTESKSNGSQYWGVYIAASGLMPGTIHTFSTYFKPEERSSILLEVRDNPPGKRGSVICDPAEIGPASEIGVSRSVMKGGDVTGGAVVDAGKGWYRCWAAMTFDLPNAIVAIYLRDGNGAISYQGDGSSGILIWGPQLESGSRPTAYIATNIGPQAKN